MCTAGPQRPDRMPEDIPDRVLEDMPDRLPEDMPDKMSGRMPEDMPDRMPEGMPERMPEKMSDRMPDRMPEDVPDKLSEDMPEDMHIDWQKVCQKICRIECPKEVCQSNGLEHIKEWQMISQIEYKIMCRICVVRYALAFHQVTFHH